jgi:surfactin synthase thioesterase subunit
MIRIYLSIACTLITVVSINALNGGYMYHVGLLFSGSCFGAMLAYEAMKKKE